jgi:arginase
MDLAPDALRQEGLVNRLGARDLGDVLPPEYRDFERPPGGVRNEDEVAAYSHELAHRVGAAIRDHSFLVVLGGDCSVVLGCLMGIRRPGLPTPGLAYVDGHADFATPQLSWSGSAASMCLALAAGRGDSRLARLSGKEPLVRERDIVLIGRRDDAHSPIYGQEELPNTPIVDLPRERIRERGTTEIARVAGERLGDNPGGFWIHVDADALDPSVMPAVDSPEPDGLTFDELSDLLQPLVAHPRALGLELTIYDPSLDPDGVCAGRLAGLLERILGKGSRTSVHETSHQLQQSEAFQ